MEKYGLVMITYRTMAEKIDVTAFMVWFVENYPESINLLKKDPALQYKLTC